MVGADKSIQQCDQIGRFLKVLGGKFSQKVAQTCGHFLGDFENFWISSKTDLGTLWATF